MPGFVSAAAGARSIKRLDGVGFPVAHKLFGPFLSFFPCGKTFPIQRELGPADVEMFPWRR